MSSTNPKRYNELAEKWLNPNLTDEEILSVLKYEQPSQLLDFWPVNSVRKVKPDDENVIAPAVYKGLPELQL